MGSATVVAAGAVLGEGSCLADHVLVRETTVLRESVMIGPGGSVGHSTLIGARTRIQNECLVAPWTVIDEDVLVGGRVTFIGDPTMGRRPEGQPARQDRKSVV